MRRQATLWTLAALAALDTLSAQSAATVRVTFTAPESISLGEPLIVIFRIENQSDRPVGFDVGEDRITRFSLSVAPPDGRSFTYVPRPLSAVPETLPNATVPPRGVYEQPIVLNQWLGSFGVGRHQVGLSFNGRLDLGGATLAGWRSTTISFDVVNRDEARLARTCARLAAEANAGPHWHARISANALAMIRDPVAIPHLVTVAQKGLWIYPAISGLERIGTPAAWAAIERLLAEGRDATLVDHAAAALARSPAYDAKRAVEAALVTAKKERKHVLLNFGAAWCLECRLLDQTFAEPEVARFLKANFVPVTIHVGRMVGQNYAELNTDLVAKYGVFTTRENAGIPSIVVLDAAGAVIARTDHGEWRRATAITPENVLHDLRRWAPSRVPSPTPLSR